ncbi:hypothetical protein LP419_13820 [Massilia sp. H-1]|nr:hypothetical protein LP419_13820 [Massilia sp. H-1]
MTQDNAQLRAAARDSAQQQALLWQGDSLEIRGEKGDYLQVYDHRREREATSAPARCGACRWRQADAGELLSVVRFLKDSSGAEALGIAYAAAYLEGGASRRDHGRTLRCAGRHGRAAGAARLRQTGQGARSGRVGAPGSRRQLRRGAARVRARWPHPAVLRRRRFPPRAGHASGPEAAGQGRAGSDPRRMPGPGSAPGRTLRRRPVARRGARQGGRERTA